MVVHFKGNTIYGTIQNLNSRYMRVGFQVPFRKCFDEKSLRKFKMGHPPTI